MLPDLPTTTTTTATAATSSSRKLVLTVLLLVRVADTGYAILAKWCLDANARGEALVFGLYRNAGAVPLLLALAWRVDGVRAPPASDLPQLAALAATGVLASQACYLMGLKMCNRRALPRQREGRACAAWHGVRACGVLGLAGRSSACARRWCAEGRARARASRRAARVHAARA
jgi:hypothetical protein